jgi:putative two-component system response regulator
MSGSPDDTERMPTSAIPRPAASPGGGARIVVVVEDDEKLRTILVRILGQKYTVYVAEDGVLGIDLLLKLGPATAALVLDVMMPRVDGISVAKRVKANPRTGHVPIVFLSAQGMPSEVADGFDAGASYYVIKPFDIQDLLDKVGRAIAGT